MTLQDAKQLKKSQTIYDSSRKDSKGNPVKYKVLSVKTWKRNQERVVVSLKHGLYKFFTVNENELCELKV